MADTEGFKELINEKFISVHTKIDLQFSSIKDTLESIDTQVKKTNGKVLKLEDTVYNLQLSDAIKSVNCPQHLAHLKEIEEEVESFKTKMNADLQEYNFFKKYPKIAIGTIAIAVIVLLLGYSEFRSALSTSKDKAKIEMNSGTIKTHTEKINQNTLDDQKRTREQNEINQELERNQDNE